MLTYDPRSISTKVFTNLNQLQQDTRSSTDKKEQKSQAVELYIYIATWGLLRLKAEETALNQDSKKQVVRCFFSTLGEIVFPGDNNQLAGRGGLDYLMRQSASEFLGLTGLALQVGREFAFWAEAIYTNVPNV